MSLQTIGQILQVVNTGAVQKTILNNLFSDDKTKFEVDPLACSVSFRRRNCEYGLKHEKEHITDEDIAQAKKIRDYYSKKYFWNSLKDTKPQTDFRLNAMRLLAIESGWNLTDRETGLFVKLPCFYEEDTTYDQFKETLITGRDTCQVGKISPDPITQKLTYLKKTLRWQGSTKRVTFWFKNDKNKLFGLTALADNPFNELFEDKIQTPQVFLITRRGLDRVADLWYNDIKKFNIVKD